MGQLDLKIFAICCLFTVANAEANNSDINTNDIVHEVQGVESPLTKILLYWIQQEANRINKCDKDESGCKIEETLISKGEPKKREIEAPAANIRGGFVYVSKRTCFNVGDEGCHNGPIPGSGKDDDFWAGPGSPGK